MGINKTIFIITGSLILLAGILITGVLNKQEEGNGIASNITIEQTWELPETLAEISGITWAGENQILGVQDEQGKIFVYNLKTSTVEKEIEFGDKGDYEGIAQKDNMVFILRSDGTIFKVDNFNSNPKVEQINTILTEREDTEGLCFDKKNNRLLVAIKEDDPDSKGSKGIFALDLTTMKLDPNPVYQLDFKEKIFAKDRKKKLQNTFKPSEINIHPSSGEIYLLEGQNPKLLVLDRSGKPKNLYRLDEKDFPQPEGITFDPSGNIYISNEGSPATIQRISIK